MNSTRLGDSPVRICGQDQSGKERENSKGRVITTQCAPKVRQVTMLSERSAIRESPMALISHTYILTTFVVASAMLSGDTTSDVASRGSGLEA